MSATDVPHTSADESGNRTDLDPQQCLTATEVVTLVTDVLVSAGRAWFSAQGPSLASAELHFRDMDLATLQAIGIQTNRYISGRDGLSTWKQWYRDSLNYHRETIEAMLSPAHRELSRRHEEFCTLVFYETPSSPKYSSEFWSTAPSLLSIDSSLCQKAQRRREAELKRMIVAVQKAADEIETDIQTLRDRQVGDLTPPARINTAWDADVLGILRAEGTAIASDKGSSAMRRVERLEELLKSDQSFH